MNKSVSVIITLTIAVTIMFAVAFSIASSIYARNATTTTPSIAGPNATTIANAINAKIKLIYDDDKPHSTIERRIMP